MTTGPTQGGASPSSSPRLPSPPPFPEVQIGPKSPTIGDSMNSLRLDDGSSPDNGALRRIRPGTKASEMASGPPMVEINELESAFQLQEYLKALYYGLTTDPKTGSTYPITKETAAQLAHAPLLRIDSSETVDRNLWLYELCRFLTMKANNIITAFFRERPQCSASTCPEMRASEWQYLCAVHDPPKSCCAIDYCCHTLDWATNILTSPKLFPSRMVLGGDNGNIAAAMRQLTNIFRRIYRIFAHAWFQHRDVFWTVEATDGLYIFFKTVCDVYQLIPEDNYTIPQEAEGEREDAEETPINASAPELMHLMKRDESAAAGEDLDRKIEHLESFNDTPEEETSFQTIIEADKPTGIQTIFEADEETGVEDTEPTAEAEKGIAEPIIDADMATGVEPTIEEVKVTGLETTTQAPTETGMDELVEADEEADAGKATETRASEDKASDDKEQEEKTADSAPAGVV